MEPQHNDTEPLAPSFFSRDTVEVARDLLGAVLVSRVDGAVTSGRIVETEAYLGAKDPGSHAATKGITRRNAVMYGPAGHAYVYFTYGNHHMLNLVTEPDGVAGAVLIRAIEPLEGVEQMRLRRTSARRAPALPLCERDLSNGPGKLACALGVTLRDNGDPLDGTATLSVLPASGPVGEIATTGRIGLSSGSDLPLRFFIEGNPYVSVSNPGTAQRSRARGKGSIQK